MRRRRFATAALIVAFFLRAASACVGEDAENGSRPPTGPDAAVTPIDAGGSAKDDATISDSSSSSCSESDPFGPLESLGPAINTTDHEYPGRFSADMLSFVFARRAAAGGQAQLFIARRSTTDVGFESAAPIFDVPTGHHDQEPAFTPWGAIVFHRGEQGNTQLMTTVPSDGGFATPVPLSLAINTQGTERSAFVASDGTLYFSRAPAGAGAVSEEYELYMAGANGDHTFAADVPVPGLTRPGQSETLPVANGAGTVLYFTGVVYYDAGEAGNRDTDFTIYRVSRASRDDLFGVPKLVEGVNTSRYESTAWVSDDDCTMVVAHRSADPGNTIDLYVTRRHRP